MTRPQITVDRAKDAERYLATDHLVWFSEVPAASPEVQLLGVPEELRFAAEIEGGQSDARSDTGSGAYPGIYGVFPLTLSIPGATVPCAGLTWVGVHPDHRRKGVLTAMLRDHFQRVRDTDGVQVSALHASEPAIYGRFGYGLASVEHDVTLSRGTTLTAPYLDQEAAALTTELSTVSDPDASTRMRACHLATATLGSVVGEAGYYDRICLELPEWRRGKEPYRVLFARRDGADVGWALFRRSGKWDNARPAGELVVWALVGEQAARLALLRRLLDFDLMGTVKVGTVGADDPLLHWAGGPRSASDVATYDSLWIRLVDLPAALQERTWSAPCDVVAEVADPHAPWNEGRWRIRADASGSVQVARTDDDADLALGIGSLGAAYLGGSNLVTLQRSGLIQERRPGAAAELWRGLRTDVPPSAAVGF